MALWKGKSEHAGDKGSSRKSGFWGTRREAKQATKKQRRTEDKRRSRGE